MRFVIMPAFVLLLVLPATSQRGGRGTPDPLAPLIERLDLEKYKATIKGLTQFGDRRAGTARNRAAIDWIEAQLKSYGCTNTERLRYVFPLTGARQATSPSGRVRGVRGPTGVSTNPDAQQNRELRALNSLPVDTPDREEVYCTKVGTTRPEEMIIVSAHMDGVGYGEAANDDGSGSAVVLELARVLHGPGVTTERSVRFAFWNNEETGLEGSRAYAAQRKDLQGKEDPPGSGRYPEPKWLGVIQHDMMLFDHGMPRADGSVSPTQRPEADVNIEFQSSSRFATESQALAWALQAANESFAAEYPATVGSHMVATDSVSFQDLVASVSVRENERGSQIGAGWDPHWHQPTDVFTTFSDADFRLGLNAAQTTLGAVARIVGARVN